MSKIKLEEIKIGKRFRKDMGDLDQLIKSIQDRGLLHPIVITPEKQLVCGRRRIAAYKKLGLVEIECTIIDIDDLVKGERDENVCREDLLPSDAVAIAKAVEEREKEAAKERQRVHGYTAPGKKKNTSPDSGEVSERKKPQRKKEQESKAKAAKTVGMSAFTLSNAQKIVAAAEKEPEKYADIVEKMDKSGKVDGAYKDLLRRQKKEELSQKRVEPLDKIGKYSIIYVDPPWTFENVTTPDRLVENQYPLMNLEDIKSLPIQDLVEDDAVLFLWCPNSKNGEAHEVIEAWGFTYKTNFVWVKDKIGLGHYNRQRHELLLVATMGKPGTPDPEDRFDSVIEAPRTKHSEKPDIVYDMIEQMYPGTLKVELFARASRTNWKSWGYEV